MQKYKLLNKIFYQRDTVQVAKDLIGKKIIRNINGKHVVGIISQTEAYMANDPACHAYRGKTERNKALFGPVGRAYVYISYGMHYCLNFVSREKSVISGGVLIRSIIPIEGQEIMLKNRPVPIKILADGPGKLTQALAISKIHNEIDITCNKSEIFVAEGITVNSQDIIASPRIGISAAKGKLWCFTLK